MESSVFKILEYHKIIEMLISQASSVLGKELAAKLKPVNDFSEVQSAMQETAEGCAVLQASYHVPLGGIRDIRKLLKKTTLGAVLETYELVDMVSTLYAMRNVKKFFKEMELEVPILRGWTQAIEILGQLENQISGIVDEHGNLRDDASIELKRIRREIKTSQSRIKERLDGVLRAAEYQKYFQETIITIRNERYVIPIKQEYRQFFPGIVHDQSASGATLFIEPMAIVTLNNDVKQLILAEKQEIDRILRMISLQIAKYADILNANCDLLGQIDFTFAKAKVAQAMHAVMPELNQEGSVDLKQARHPLIDANHVVPIDIRLGKEYNTLLITGPNTGGKTVSMKTLGLLALMTQSGLFIPVLSGSEMAVFHEVFADIGDEQSIEQSLSTFSAHMTHLVNILEKVEYDDLLLIDEIGAGTDPEEGAALAMAMLEQLMNIGTKVLATTHYSELKTFAYSKDGIENACVEFDINTLSPTYRLLIGIPGASNAFAISKRLGLADSLIIRAKQLIDADHAQFEKVLNTLEAEKIMYEQRNADIVERQRKVEQLERKMTELRSDLTKKKEKIILKAQEDSAALIRRTRREASQLIKDLKEQFNDQGIQKRQAAIDAARNKIKEGLDRTTTQVHKQHPFTKPISLQTLSAGDTVYVTTLDQKGIVLSIHGKSIAVQLGSLKMNVAAANCMFVESARQVDQKSGSSQKKAKSMNFLKTTEVNREIDIRGMLVDDAREMVDKYLDDAILAGLSQVIIIHGNGTGALRKGMQAYLKSHRSVASTSMGGLREGGTGVTVVELK
ncbi:DNA mismatch repair protein MutS2 [Propionispira arboris]|uniref:Endonuclease MutS2 n=1 Tax=Propionispira arboris TaxID=84035 RepID=A0A1H6XPK3_9FIRM|nr:endonuclease MutS2 [Propionispira arboris]SEJ30993.1 DNA mismatch repair protein MutS2 [Propionispira arboris]